MESGSKNGNKISHNETGREYKLPEYETIFRIKRNPLISDPLVKEWVEQSFEFSLIPADKWTKIVPVIEFVAYMYPFCSDKRRFENLIKIYLIFFILDDHTECHWGDVARDVTKSNFVWGQVIEAMDKLLDTQTFTSMRSWKPYVCLMYNAFEDMCQELDPNQKKRIVMLWKDYAIATKTETNKMDVEHKFETLEEYIEIKRNSMGVYCVFDFIEYADGIPLTDEEWLNTHFQKTILLALDSVILANDIGSFEKEYKEQDKKLGKFYNTIAYTMIKDDCSVDEAMGKIGKMLEEIEKKTKESMNDMLSNKSTTENQKAFLERLDYVIGANFYCGKILDRYNKFSPEPQSTERKTIEVNSNFQN